MIKFTIRTVGAAGLTLASAIASGAQTAGKDLAIDFRTTTAVESSPDSGVITGHMVSTGQKIRMDISTVGGRAPTPFATDGVVSMIVSDTGRTITYLDAKNKQFMRFRPAEMFAEAQQMGGMKMEFSGVEATATSLGAGPVILGHPTARYRVVMGVTMTISGMGQQQTARMSSTAEHYLATDIPATFNPFGSVTGTDILGMFGGSNKEMATKMKALEAQLPRNIALRIVSSSSVSGQGMNTTTRSTTEVTAVRWVNADPKVFEVPAGYTAVQMPGMAGPPPTP